MTTHGPQQMTGVAARSPVSSPGNDKANGKHTEQNTPASRHVMMVPRLHTQAGSYAKKAGLVP